MYENIAIIGASGAIGNAFVNRLLHLYPKAKLHVFSRSYESGINDNLYRYSIDYTDETSIAHAAAQCTTDQSLDLVLVTTGILYDEALGIKPEKSLHDLSFEAFDHIFRINAAIPAIIAKYFIPKLSRSKRSVFAAISARVGSISDNQLGGWYAYRASKSALNMIIKNAAIESQRRNKNSIIVGLHPGTVDSHLSKPFQGNVPENKLFTPEQSATYLMDVINTLTESQNGQCFAWNGQEILP